MRPTDFATTSSTPERRFRAAEGTQDATRQAPTQPCVPNDRWIFFWFFVLPCIAVCGSGVALIWWLL
ncbi:MAG: hypothetical protein EP318_15565 [Rhodobacteraceae bacterium]|nr:MAG: hypothetical protein EP318_15565 [Paracoccaceae bacterium]